MVSETGFEPVSHRSSTYRSTTRATPTKWLERSDSNWRLLASKASTLTKLRYSPIIGYGDWNWTNITRFKALRLTFRLLRNNGGFLITSGVYYPPTIYVTSTPETVWGEGLLRLIVLPFFTCILGYYKLKPHNGCEGRDWTYDPLLNRQLLLPLSYFTIFGANNWNQTSVRWVATTRLIIRQYPLINFFLHALTSLHRALSTPSSLYCFPLF